MTTRRARTKPRTAPLPRVLDTNVFKHAELASRRGAAADDRDRAGLTVVERVHARREPVRFAIPTHLEELARALGQPLAPAGPQRWTSVTKLEDAGLLRKHPVAVLDRVLPPRSTCRAAANAVDATDWFLYALARVSPPRAEIVTFDQRLLDAILALRTACGVRTIPPATYLEENQ